MGKHEEYLTFRHKYMLMMWDIKTEFLLTFICWSSNQDISYRYLLFGCLTNAEIMEILAKIAHLILFSLLFLLFQLTPNKAFKNTLTFNLNKDTSPDKKDEGGFFYLVTLPPCIGMVKELHGMGWKGSFFFDKKKFASSFRGFVYFFWLLLIHPHRSILNAVVPTLKALCIRGAQERYAPN